MRNIKSILITMLLLSSLLSACAGVAAAQPMLPALQTGTAETPATTPRTISVGGSGIAYLTPDIAYINVGVHTEDKDASQAVTENNTRSNQVSEAIKELGIDEKDIQTTNFSIYPQQEYDRDGKPTGEITYIVDNSIFVTIRDLDLIGDLLNASVAAGANTINSIRFDVADQTAALSTARSAAMENARLVAEELASAAGVSLGDVQSITTYSSEMPSPVYAEGRGGAGAMMADSVPISPGQMSITVQVNVVYLIQ